MLFIYCGITSIKFFSKNYPVLCCVLCGWFLPCFTIWYPGANSTFPGWRFDLCLGIPSEKHSPSLLCILRILVNWSWRENHLKWITCAVDKYIQLTICSRKTLPNFDSIWCPILDWCNSPILSSHWSGITMRESGSIVYVYIYIYTYIYVHVLAIAFGFPSASQRVDHRRTWALRFLGPEIITVVYVYYHQTICNICIYYLVLN